MRRAFTFSLWNETKNRTWKSTCGDKERGRKNKQVLQTHFLFFFFHSKWGRLHTVKNRKEGQLRKFNCKPEDSFKTIWENIQKTTFTVINYFKSLSLPSSKCHLFVYLIGRNALCQHECCLMTADGVTFLSCMSFVYVFFKRGEYNAASLLLRHFANDWVLQLSVLLCNQFQLSWATTSRSKVHCHVNQTWRTHANL